MTPDEIRIKLATMQPWHHNVELAPGLWTNPKMGTHPTKRWELIEPYVPANLEGKTVLDVGCSSGFFSAMFKKRGAERVVAVDLVDSAIEEARMLTGIFQTPVEIVQAEIGEFLAQNEFAFDYVIYMGLFYHLRSPLDVLDRLKAVTRERMYFQTWVRNDSRVHTLVKRWLFAFYELGVLTKQGTPGKAVKTALTRLVRPLEIPDNITMRNSYLLSHPDFPRLEFIQNRMNDDSTNWWVGDTRAIRAILDSTGFSRVQPLSADTFICDR